VTEWDRDMVMASLGSGWRGATVRCFEPKVAGAEVVHDLRSTTRAGDRVIRSHGDRVIGAVRIVLVTPMPHFLTAPYPAADERTGLRRSTFQTGRALASSWRSLLARSTMNAMAIRRTHRVKPRGGVS
jgi:hypothetical protein